MRSKGLTLPIAYNLTRRETYYRHEVFSAGLRAAGYEVKCAGVDGRPGDVMLCWNRYGEYDQIATRFEKMGGKVIVAENGYLRGPKDGGDYYAMAVGGHNGSGAISMGGPERWAALSLDLAPWRADGGHVLVAPNRSFGTPGRIQPEDWTRDVAKRLAKLTKREIRVRPHPHNDPPKKPLADDLAGAWAVVVWGSSAGVKALVAGIPVIHECPRWICEGATDPRGIAGIEDPWMDDGDRLEAMQRLAWSQWSLAEIEAGLPFEALKNS